MTTTPYLRALAALEKIEGRPIERQELAARLGLDVATARRLAQRQDLDRRTRLALAAVVHGLDPIE